MKNCETFSIVMSIFLLFSCNFLNTKNEFEDCLEEANIFIIEETQICKKLNNKIFTGGLLFDRGKEKAFFILYVIKNEEDNYEILESYSFEPINGDFFNTAEYYINESYLVFDYKRDFGNKISYVIKLEDLNNFDFSLELQKFEKSLISFND